MSLQFHSNPGSREFLYYQHSTQRPIIVKNSKKPTRRRKAHQMSSAILSAFPRPPTHIPNSPLPLTPTTANGSASGSRPPTPGTSGRRTPGASEKSFQAQQGPSPFSSSTDIDAARREKRRSRGTSLGAKSNNSGHDRLGEEAMPRMSVESAVVFAEGRGRMGDSSPLESTFSHSTHGTESRRVSHYENLRRSLHNAGGDAGGSSRGSHYSTNTGEGAISNSGSSSLGVGNGPGSAFSSRPGSFVGPGTPPLNVPLSASARLAALRAKRAGLGSLALGTPGGQPSTPTSIGWAGPPPTTPLPPIPTAGSDGKKTNRRSVNLASPVQSAYPFPTSRDKDSGEVSTPTAHGFHRSNPSGATFGHGIGGGGMRAGDHSRGSSFGSTMDGASSLAPSIFRSGAGGRGISMGLGNGSVSTFGGAKNASTSSFGEEGSSGNGGYGHSASYSISSAGTAFAGGASRSPRESFGPGLAAIAALSRGELANGSPISQYSDPNSSSPSGKSAYSTPGIQTYPPRDNDEDDAAPLDIQKELEKIRREKADRRVSSASMLSNMSTRTTNTFRGATSRVMDVNPDEVRDDEAAELAGERLLGSVGDGLEGLAAFGKRRGLGNKLGTASAASSRPGSSRGPPSTLGPGVTKTTNATSESTRLHSPSFQTNARSSATDEADEDGDLTITLPRGGLQQPTREGKLGDLGRRPSDNDTIETFESGVIGSGSHFAARLSAEVDNRASNGSTVSSQHHLMMKGPSRTIPELTVEETSANTPLAFNKSLPDNASSSQYHRTAPATNGVNMGSDRLVNIGVWDDAPVTPRSGGFNTSSRSAENSEAPGRRSEGSEPSASSSARQIPTTSASSTLDVMGTPRQARSPSPSGTSYSHTTIRPSNTGNGAMSISSGKPSLDIDRPDSPMSTASSSKHRFMPPALSLSLATPLSSEASLVMPDEDDDILASPSAGRDRGNVNGKEAFVSRKPQRASKDFAMKMEKEMIAGGMGEFAFLQEITIREKRLKLAMFRRGAPATLTKPESRRPQSMFTIEKKLPDSPERESASRADGTSSPELEDMIKRSRRSLNAKAMRRRRSTGAMATYGNAWRRSEVDLAFGVTKKAGEGKGPGRRAMELDRSGVNVRDSIVHDLPSEEQVPDQEQDGSADSDSSIDLHTPLPRLMLRAGLLSPHSKILRPPTPEEDPRASWMTNKNGLKVPLDKRNTDKRKRRHRDGKLLREGVGLTTGLGWSDSEDEDAPSPLTRRLSTMTLTSSVSRKASMASSMSSFATTSMTSLHLSRSPSMPSIPAGAEMSSESLVSKNSSESGSDTTSRRSGPPSKAMVITGRSPYNRPPENLRPALKPSATMSIIEHAQMLPTASLFTSRNHPLASSNMRGTFNYSMTSRRSSSPADNSSQSSNGGVIHPVTPDADLSPSLANGGSPNMLKDIRTPEDVQGASGGTSMGINPNSYSGAGTGLAGLSVARGRSYTSPPSPTPPGMAMIPDSDQPTPARPRPAEVRYSGGNFSYPTNGRPTGPSHPSTSSTGTTVPPTPAVPATPALRKPEGLRKPTPRGLQPLTLPVVVHAGGRLSPRAGTFALPSSPSLNPTNPTTPKKTGLPHSGMLLSKSTSNIATPASPAPPSAFSRGRSGSTGSSSSNGTIPFAPAKVSSRMPQPLGTRPVNRSRTLSGGGGIGIPTSASPTPPVPNSGAPSANVSFSALPSPSAGRRGLVALKSLVGSRSISETSTAVPKMLGVARTASAPGSPPVRPGAANGKTGSGMSYRKSAGSAVEAATTTPPRSRIGLPPPSSTSRLAAPTSYSLTRTSSTASLTPSVVGVAL